MKNTMENIPVLILAGGLGTRLGEETSVKPKPMVDIGDTPALVHIMRWYYGFGFNNFVILAGYKSWEIKNYFLHYEYKQNHIEIDHRKSTKNPPFSIGENKAQEDWRIRILDTGEKNMTGSRVAQALDFLSREEKFDDFAITYGDGLSNVDLQKEYLFHRSHQKIGTILGVAPASRFGELEINAHGQVMQFLEKPKKDMQNLHNASNHTIINGGYMFFKKELREFVSKREDCILEIHPLIDLAQKNELMTFLHNGFWQPMDTLRDKMLLERVLEEGKGSAPWIHPPSKEIFHENSHDQSPTINL